MLLTAFLIATAASAAQTEPLRPAVNCSTIAPRPGIIVEQFEFVFFESNSARITPQAAAMLDRFVGYYNAQASCHVYVAAHTDRVGSEGDNLVLSRRRAEAVTAYLRSRGITSQINAEFYGETRPLIDTADGVAEAENRRAEVLAGQPRSDAPR